MMAISLLASALMAGAVAAAIAAAPLAGADVPDSAQGSAATEAGQRGPNAAAVKPPRSVPNNATSDYSSSQIPQGWRNDALWAKPGAPGSNQFGTAKRPPVIALD